eukprot:TRINITY_DN404_c0_g1_i1.p1 TRINITY_DN404_c0_g1~~TRINITY_DN404_c0_g1_i1.p1  ORF type:complete len:756 (+),score=195.29 TRINITY_DN404_c0_g1_i1:7-2274(+)
MKQLVALVGLLCFIQFTDAYLYDLPKYYAPPYPWVKEVVVTYGTHLDVGFTNFAKNVCETYFYHHFPAVIETARTIEYLNRTEQFVYTTHPWLLLEYLDGAAQCTDIPRTPEQIRLMENAINKGYITWHAKAFSELCEVADSQLFEEGIKLSRILDQRFKQSKKLTAISKDVLGVSRSILPILAKQGVNAIHIGANAACLPAALPQIFKWRYQTSEILTMFYNGLSGFGYGGNVTIPEMEVALVYNFTMDNSDPQDIEKILELWDYLKWAYPNAKVRSGTLDQFVDLVKKDKYYNNGMPVFTGEMGDTWLYGTGADPFRTSKFREIRRTMREFTSKVSGPHDYLNSTLRRLMKIPEHNWGLSDGGYLPGPYYGKYWSNVDFNAHRYDPQGNYPLLEAAWSEARGFLHNVPQRIVKQAALTGDEKKAMELAVKIEQNLNNIVPRKADIERDGWLPISKIIADYQEGDDQMFQYDEKTSVTSITTPLFDLQLNGSGTIVYLRQKSPTNYLWADASHPLASFIYQTFTNDDYVRFNKEYNYLCVGDSGGVCPDFGKLGMQDTYSVRADWIPQVVGMFQKNYTDRVEVLIQLQLDPQSSVIFGAPKQVELYIIISTQTPSIKLELQWFEKTATRLPEAMWLKFRPIVGDPKNWWMDVMGSPVSPYEVVVNGSRHMHAVWEGIWYKNQNTGVNLNITSLDAHLVAPGDTDHLLWFDGQNLPDVDGGMHFNIYNNLWGTAFNQWYYDDARFRWELKFLNSR